MAGFFEAAQRGIKAAKDSFGPGKFEDVGINIVCPYCKNDRLERSQV